MNAKRYKGFSPYSLKTVRVTPATRVPRNTEWGNRFDRIFSGAGRDSFPAICGAGKSTEEIGRGNLKVQALSCRGISEARGERLHPR